MACSGNILVSTMNSAALEYTYSNIEAGGGIGTTTNRTYWPVTGGAVAFQPGWFRGHETATVYVNLGYGTDGPDGGPQNMNNPMIPAIQVRGPTNGPYPGTICFPQVPLPKNADVKVGDKATIQIVELAVHGAALFSVCQSLATQTFDLKANMIVNSVSISNSLSLVTPRSPRSTRRTATTAPSSASLRSSPSRPSILTPGNVTTRVRASPQPRRWRARYRGYPPCSPLAFSLCCERRARAKICI